MDDQENVLARPSVGSCWRILVQEPHLEMGSGNYTALDGRRISRPPPVFERGGIFDELAIMFDPESGETSSPFTQHNSSCLHLEQMDERNWYLGMGDLQFNIHVNEQTLVARCD